jgi:hypothetical protein
MTTQDGILVTGNKERMLNANLQQKKMMHRVGAISLSLCFRKEKL